MLNSTKTWQERFDELEILSLLNDKDPIYGEENQLAKYKLKQFISDLRKRDMEALTGMLPKDDNSETFLYRNRVKKIIKDYYEN